MLKRSETFQIKPLLIIYLNILSTVFSCFFVLLLQLILKQRNIGDVGVIKETTAEFVCFHSSL